MPTLTIRKQKKEANAVKPVNVYVDTHEKLLSLSAESGLPIVKLLAIFVDFSMENMVLVEPENNYKAEG